MNKQTPFVDEEKLKVSLWMAQHYLFSTKTTEEANEWGRHKSPNK